MVFGDVEQHCKLSVYIYNCFNTTLQLTAVSLASVVSILGWDKQMNRPRYISSYYGYGQSSPKSCEKEERNVINSDF